MTSPDALRSLAALVRSTGSLRTAIESWPGNCPSRDVGSAHHASRLVLLGAAAGDALRAAGAPADVAAGVDVMTRTGGSVSSLLEDLAADADRRHALEDEARAAAAGALLSGRMMTWLPLAVLPFLPVDLDALRRPPVCGLVGAGLLMLAAGMRNIRRLAPPPPAPDAAASVAILMATVLRGGAPLPVILEAAARGGVGGPALAAAWRRVVLGASCATALAGSDDAGFRALGEVLRTAERTGVALSAALASFAVSRRAAQTARLQREARRAPVRMIVPLALAVLPGFILIAFAPMLGALGGT